MSVVPRIDIELDLDKQPDPRGELRAVQDSVVEYAVKLFRDGAEVTPAGRTATLRLSNPAGTWVQSFAGSVEDGVLLVVADDLNSFGNMRFELELELGGVTSIPLYGRYVLSPKVPAGSSPAPVGGVFDWSLYSGYSNVGTHGPLLVDDETIEVKSTTAKGQPVLGVKEGVFEPVKLNNPNGSGVPGVNDDETQGYSFGSIWVDRSGSPSEIYKCVDATEGAAEWVNTSLTLEDLGSMALEDAGDYLGITATAADVDPTGPTIAGALAGKVGTGDSRLTDAREWTADTVSQAEAETGTATTRRAWTAQRVRQAINAVSVLLTGNQTISGQKTFESAPDTAGLILNKTAGDGFQSIEFHDDGFPAWDFFQDRALVGATLVRGFGLYSIQLDHTFMFMNTTGDVIISPWTAGGGRLRLEGLTDVEGTLRLSASTGNRPLWLNADNDVEAIESSEFASLLGLDDEAGKDWPIEAITGTTSITDLRKVYSLQGAGSYAVTLPESSSANEGQIIKLYKEGASGLGNWITLQTVSSQTIRYNAGEFQQIRFRFTGESVILISHGDHWDVLASSEIFDKAIPVGSETQFLNAIEKLNWLGGGTIIIYDQINITDVRPVDLTGIRIIGDSGSSTQINIPANARLDISGSGFYFDSVRFAGVRTSRGHGLSQYFLNLLSDDVNSGKFENCTFRDLLTANRNIDDGNIKLTRVGTGGGWNLTFTDCDVFTGGSGDVAGLEFRSTANFWFTNVSVFNHKRMTNQFNRIIATGTPIQGNNFNLLTDGSGVADLDVTGPTSNLMVPGNQIITQDVGLVDYLTQATTVQDTDQIILRNNNGLRRLEVSKLKELEYDEIVMISPDNTRWKLSVNNDGNLITEEVV